MRLRRSQSRYVLGVSDEEWVLAMARLGRAVGFLAAVVVTMIVLAVLT